ncbi:MAG: extracellular solute-binding protein [Bifidobacteriaceae bacterium]|jgi:ABC-type glycerol-3-phosphate transport system substrate-binding protein|nr:extracellular solute-binding protein [Bifidobacteriaceae bacterium]
MRKSRLLVAAGTTLVLIAGLAACGDSSPTGSDSGSSSTASSDTGSDAGSTEAAGTDSGATTTTDGGEAAGSELSGTINWWAYAPDVMVAEQYIAAFNEVYPNITVVYKNFENTDYQPAIQPALKSDQGPDVFAVAPGGNVADKRLFTESALDLTSFGEEALGADWKDKFANGYVDQLSVDGKVLGIPTGGVGAGFFWYNADLFAEYGLTPPTTYQEFVDVCKVFNDAGITCFTSGAGGEAGFVTETLRVVVTSIDPTFYEAALKGEKSWEDPVMVEAIGIMRQMVEDGIIQDDAVGILQYPDSNNAFMSGKAAIVQMGTWYTQYAVEASAIAAAEAAGVSNPVPFTQLWFPSPDFAGKGNYPGFQQEVDLGLAINAKSENIELAKAFIEFICMTDEGQQAVMNGLDLLPGLKGAGPDWNNLVLVDQAVQQPAFETLFSEAMESTETRNLYRSPETSMALLKTVQQTLATNDSAESILKTLQENVVPPS